MMADPPMDPYMEREMMMRRQEDREDLAAVPLSELVKGQGGMEGGPRRQVGQGVGGGGPTGWMQGGARDVSDFTSTSQEEFRRPYQSKPQNYSSPASPSSSSRQGGGGGGGMGVEQAGGPGASFQGQSQSDFVRPYQSR